MVVAARQTDSGHHSVEEADMMAELPARIADMEGQIRILRDTNKRKLIFVLTVGLGRFNEDHKFYQNNYNFGGRFFILKFVLSIKF